MEIEIHRMQMDPRLKAIEDLIKRQEESDSKLQKKTQQMKDEATKDVKTKCKK